MQRVRIGLTGLAFVFVLVMLAAVFTSHSSEEAITANLIERGRSPEQPAVNAAAEDAGPTEPLAELGVAPGNADSNSAKTKSGEPRAPGR
jgi:hypothetical protein